METLSEVKSSWYGTKFVVCPKCRLKAGYHSFFDFNKNISFRCNCGKTLTQIKRIYGK